MLGFLFVAKACCVRMLYCVVGVTRQGSRVDDKSLSEIEKIIAL